MLSSNAYGLNPRDPRMVAMQQMSMGALNITDDKKRPGMMIYPYDMMLEQQRLPFAQRGLLLAQMQQMQQQQQSRNNHLIHQQQHHQQQSHHQIQQQQRRASKAKPSKRVIAINLPPNLHTIESVTTIFYPYGEVLLVRVLRPLKTLPFDLKQFQPKVPDLGKTVCAIIEYEGSDAAKFAVNTLRQRTKELGFRLALLENGAEEDLYGPIFEPQLPMLKPGQATPGYEDSGVELSATGRSSSDGSQSERTTSSDSDSDSNKNIKLTQKWNLNVQEFRPGSKGSSKSAKNWSPAEPPASPTKVVPTATVTEDKGGRIRTTMTISLSKAPAVRHTSKITLTEKKAVIQYSKEFLLSLRSSKTSLVKPPLQIEEEEIKRYAPPQRRRISHPSPTSDQPMILSPQRRSSHVRR